MGTASTGYPFGIAVHSHGNSAVLPHKLEFSRSKFPLQAEFSRANPHSSSVSSSSAKVVKHFLFDEIYAQSFDLCACEMIISSAIIPNCFSTINKLFQCPNHLSFPSLLYGDEN